MKDGRNQRAPTQKEGEEGLFPHQKNENENMQAHTRTTNIPKEELVTSIHSTTNSYLTHGM